MQQLITNARRGTNIKVIGHRGARAVSPQNTLPSFEVALRLKIPMIELDTELTSDGRVVIFHDDKVDQITRGQSSGSVNSFSFKQLRALNVHDGFGDGKFYQVPTLEEVLDLVDKHKNAQNGRTRVNIELKGASTAGPVAKIVKQYLANSWEPNDFIISSFRHDELEKFKKLIPQIAVAVLLDKEQWQELGGPEAAVGRARTLDGVAINPDKDFTSLELVKTAHSHGLEVNVYTVNEAEDIIRMAEIGVDGIFTDDPAKAQKILSATV